MNSKKHSNIYYVSLFIIGLMMSQSGYAQLGIGTTDPATGTILHINDDTGSSGVLIPKVDISNQLIVAPLPVGTHEGTLVYNTNTITGEGFYYWDGTQWRKINDSTGEMAKFTNRFASVFTENLNVPQSTGGTEAQIMDTEVFNDNAGLYVIPAADTKKTNLQVNAAGRYLITVSLSMHSDRGDNSIETALKITRGGDNLFPGGDYRSSEMTASGDDDGTVSFTEIHELKAGDQISVRCFYAEGKFKVFLREAGTSSIFIEKIE